MKTQMQTKPRQKTWMDQLNHIRYLHALDHSTRQPMTDKKGIRCVGEECGFIVDWQVDENKSKDVLAS